MPINVSIYKNPCVLPSQTSLLGSRHRADAATSNCPVAINVPLRVIHILWKLQLLTLECWACSTLGFFLLQCNNSDYGTEGCSCDWGEWATIMEISQLGSVDYKNWELYSLFQFCQQFVAFMTAMGNEPNDKSTLYQHWSNSAIAEKNMKTHESTIILFAIWKLTVSDLFTFTGT